MADDFNRCMAPVLVYEGGKVDDPRDPGGRTNQGVIQRVYDGWRANKNLPKRDVYLMTPDERDAIYRKQYWDKVMGDDLPAGVSFVVFDGAVNSGPSQSAKWLQRALNLPVVDGIIGEATISACWAHPDHDALVRAMCARRLAYLKALRTWKTYNKGWTARVREVEKRGQLWANGGTATMPVMFFDGGNVKATLDQGILRPSGAAANATAGGGVATSGVGGTLQTVQEQLSPYTENSPIVQRVIIALIVLGAVTAIGGFVWSRYQKRKQLARADALDLPMPGDVAVEAS